VGPVNRARAAVVVAALLALAACSGPPAVTAPVASAPPAGTGDIGFELLDGTPAPHQEAAIEAAFDRTSAAALLHPLPKSIDFAKQAVLCLHLGKRTGKWGFGINALNLEDGALHISAAERAPRAGDTSTSHPAQCLAVEREGLPAGDLAVTADDTVSDEFIVDGIITVPAAENAP
jgi:hypothetical protein